MVDEKGEDGRFISCHVKIISNSYDGEMYFTPYDVIGLVYVLLKVFGTIKTLCTKPFLT